MGADTSRVVADKRDEFNVTFLLVHLSQSGESPSHDEGVVWCWILDGSGFFQYGKSEPTREFHAKELIEWRLSQALDV